MKKLSISEFIDIAQTSDERIELIDGVLCNMPPSSVLASVIAARITSCLAGFTLSHGYVTGANGGYEFGENTVRVPDVAYISKERAGSLDGFLFQAAPEIAAEVISPSESNADVMNKIETYLKAGTMQVWVVYPETQTVDVWTLAADNSLNVRRAVDALDGGDALPGFKLKTGDIFPKNNLSYGYIPLNRISAGYCYAVEVNLNPTKRVFS